MLTMSCWCEVMYGNGIMAWCDDESDEWHDTKHTRTRIHEKLYMCFFIKAFFNVHELINPVMVLVYITCPVYTVYTLKNNSVSFHYEKKLNIMDIYNLSCHSQLSHHIEYSSQ